jgi:hypothetical protein
MMTEFTQRKLWYPPPASPTGEDQQAVGGVREGSVTARLQEVWNKGRIRLGLQREGLGTVFLPGKIRYYLPVRSMAQRCDVMVYREKLPVCLSH